MARRREGWEKQPAKRRQKDTDARWTKKHGKSHYGYKNHVNVDRRHKLVRRYQVTDAAVHDSQVVEDILDADNTASDVWADSAYRSAEIEAKLGEKGLKSRIHRKGHRNKPLNEREKRGNEDPFEGAGSGGARLRGPEQRHGRDAGARHRAGAGQGTDRAEETSPTTCAVQLERLAAAAPP